MQVIDAGSTSIYKIQHGRQLATNRNCLITWNYVHFEMNVLIKTTLNDAVHSRTNTVDVWTNFMCWFHFQWLEICCIYIMDEWTKYFIDWSMV